MKPINGLPPFKRFCVTIGNLPSSYVDSMSYYECLMWLCKYLKETVVPTINENAEAVNELINWFNTLDVQDEINTKLDEMVESGKLQEIISEYLDSTAVFGFDTVSDMVQATNLINGSYARTCGKVSFNDGKSALYKIRTVTNDDVVDGDKIIKMQTSDTLVAERIFENIKNEKVLIIGDSFIAQYPTNNWGLKLVNLMGLSSDDYTILGEGGAGVYNVGNQNTNFLGLLQANIGNIDNKKLYTKIIIGGGYNDGNATTTEMLLPYIESLVNYCKQQFPNAKIYFSCFGWTMKYDNILFRQRICGAVIPAYKQCSKYGAYYLDNTEYCYRDVNLFEGTNPATESFVHPNENGQSEIAQAIYEGLTSGFTPRVKSSNIAFDISTSSNVTAINMFFTHFLTPFSHVINLNGSLNISATYDGSNQVIADLGLMPDPYLRRNSEVFGSITTVQGRFYTTNSKVYYCDMKLDYRSDGHITLTIPRGLVTTSVDINSIIVADSVSFDRYYW